VVCLVLWPVLGPFWSAIIGTREERGARDLLQTVRSTEPAAQRARLAREVGEAIRKLHDAGVDHRDLQLRNIVVAHQKNARRIVIVDLDKAVYHPRGTLPMSARARNLGRLTRSVIKNGLWETRIGEREASAFLEGYTATDPVLRDKLRAWVRRERLKIRIHRLRYRWAG
jgi:tRNA A-37 threonylcarbamoyl transferase component Bud32